VTYHCATSVSNLTQYGFPAPSHVGLVNGNYVSDLQRLSPEISSGLKLVKEFQPLLAGKQADWFDHQSREIRHMALRSLRPAQAVSLISVSFR
jgi:hypothetical protein